MQDFSFASERVYRLVLYCAALLALALSGFWALKYSGQPIVEQHAFRQTQTALSTYWISQSPLTIPYQTPALGSPWAIPFEFPIYEYAVSRSAGLLGSDLQQTGRLVSYAFLLLCLLPVGTMLRRLFPGHWREHLAAFSIVFLSSPLYLFWGRTFMVETAALFFAL